MKATRMQNLHPYVPGEQPDDRTYIKLNANENPYPPAAHVSESVAEFIRATPQKMGLYPDPDSNALKTAIADMLNKTGGVLSACSLAGKHFGNEGQVGDCVLSAKDKFPFPVTPDMIYCGNGSDEVLSFIYYAFFDSDRPLVLPEFSYSFYPVYAGFYNIPLDRVPLCSDWTINGDAMVDHAINNDSGMIFANPNAPTGCALRRNAIRQMLQRTPKDRVFVVDEAYVDFGGESCIPLLSEFNNLVIVRTFSKSFCGAGMRLGYLVASPELVSVVTTVKNSLNHFPLDAITQIAGAAACDSAPYYVDCARRIVEEREKFCGFLNSIGWKVIPSCTNFVFTEPKGYTGKEVYELLKKKGILIRRFDTVGIENFLRITIGTSRQMQILCESIRNL